MNPDLWAFVVAETRDTLIELRPDAADTFTVNAAGHMADITRLGQRAGCVARSDLSP